MVRLFRGLTVRPGERTLPLVSKSDLSLQLYERGFMRDFLEMAEGGYGWNFQRLLPELYDGRFKTQRYAPDRNDIDICHVILLKLAEYLCSTIDGFPGHLVDMKRGREELVSRLELDGFSLVGGQLIPSESEVVNQPEEVSLLKRLIKQATYTNERVVFSHYEEAEKLFVQQQWGPAISEWRKFFEAILRGIAQATSQNRPDVKKDIGPMKNLFDYLEEAGFLDNEERQIVGSTWGFLSMGAHPGIPEPHKARLAMHQALVFGQMLTMKYVNWREQSFRGF
jgi:hypothetical protein